MDTTEHASKAMQVTAKILQDLGEVFSFSLVVTSGGGDRTRAWFDIEGFEEERTLQLAGRVSVLMSQHATWLGLGAPELAEPDVVEDFRYEIVPGPGALIEPHHTWSPAWNSASMFDGRTSLRVGLVEIVCADDEDPTALMTVVVSGDSPDAKFVAVSYAQELSVARTFIARPFARGAEPGWVRLTLRECGRALSTPSRISADVAWADGPVMQFEDVIRGLREATGAVAIFGGSGNGKTTLMEHVGVSCLAEGEVLVVICPHGQLTSPLAVACSRLGRPVDAIWFGDTEASPAFNLLQSPHRSVPLSEWLQQVPEIILAAHRAMGLTYEMAGPAWYFNFTAAIETLAFSGVGTILDSAALLSDGELSEELDEAIRNLEDEGLRRRIRQARGSILGSSDGSTVVWQNSKLNFLQAPRVRAVLGTTYSSFDFDGLFEEGRSLLVSASTADLGEHGSSVIITALLKAIYEIARRRPPDQRRRIRVMIPEAHLVCPVLLRTLLAEGRKFGISGMVVDLQTPSTLERNVMTSLLGNAGAIASFRLSPVDAAALDGRYPTISATRIQQLPPFRMAVSFGSTDALVDTRPPLSDPDDATAFREAHLRTNGGDKAIQSAVRSGEAAPSGTRANCDEAIDEQEWDEIDRIAWSMIYGPPD